MLILRSVTLSIALLLSAVGPVLAADYPAPDQNRGAGTNQSPSQAGGIHFTTKEELAAMQPMRAAVTQPQQAAIQNFLRAAGRGQLGVIICDTVLVGTIRISTGSQTCTFYIARVECGGDPVGTHVTIDHCTIN